MSQALPLAGIRVIDYSHFLAGPYVGRCLAALGAEVIKVERPGSGDAGRQHAFTLDEQQSGYFLQLNMGKQGVSVNMKDPRGKAFMQRLTDSADVFIENYRPGALDKLGLGYAELSARNPRLVYCSISAYGHTGPDAHRAGFGLIAEAKSGIMQMVGVPGEAPPLLRISLGDMYTGIHAVAAINAALLGRVNSGRGQHIDMALYDTLVSMHEYAVQCYTLSDGTVLPEQTGHDMPTSTLYGVFRAADGDLVIAAQVDDAWKRFAAMLEANGGPAGSAATAATTASMAATPIARRFWPWFATGSARAWWRISCSCSMTSTSPAPRCSASTRWWPTRRLRRATWSSSSSTRATVPCACPTCRSAFPTVTPRSTRWPRTSVSTMPKWPPA